MFNDYVKTLIADNQLEPPVGYTGELGAGLYLQKL